MGETLRFVLCAVFLGVGLVAMLLGVFGVYRWRFVLNRMHCSAIIDTLALGCILISLILAIWELGACLKLVAIGCLLWMGSPISSHLVSKLEIRTDETAGAYMREDDDGAV